MKYLLLGTILLLFLILLYQINIKEGFNDAGPQEVSLPIRSDGSCSDPNMLNMFDRFHYADVYNTNINGPTGCPDNYVQYNYFGNSNICLPNCPLNYSIYPIDDTYCVATQCYVAGDLSGNIRESWNEVCSVLYRTDLILNSTIASISSVTNTVNIQYNTINSNFIPFSNHLYTSGVDSNKLAIRDVNFPNILSNYNDIYSYQNVIQSNYLNLKDKKTVFDTLYTGFNCSNYQ